LESEGNHLPYFSLSEILDSDSFSVTLHSVFFLICGEAPMAERFANREAALWNLRGAVFQFPMILIWACMPAYVHGIHWDSLLGSTIRFDFSGLMQAIGLSITAFCMFRIYRGQRTPELITVDVFALTRHPMYHGMFIANASLFFEADLRDPLFWIMWALYTGCTLTAGWSQEKETLARWPDEAAAYYQRTPRFIFEWLWRF
jgi:protein-S-isoprenylcysteine O-methyltransferase Ste14